MILRADARELPLLDDSVDCVLTSPLQKRAIHFLDRCIPPFSGGEHRLVHCPMGRRTATTGAWGELATSEFQYEYGLAFLGPQIRQHGLQNGGRQRIADAVTVECPTIPGLPALQVIPPTECPSEESNGRLVYHPHLNPLVIDGADGIGSPRPLD